MKLFREITPVKTSDVIVVLDSVNKGFDYPIHNHPEYEITLVLNSAGTRIVGDSSEIYSVKDLVITGPYLFHKWDDSLVEHNGMDCRVITIQFDMHLFDGTLMSKHPFEEIKKLLHRSRRGVYFTGQTRRQAEVLMDEITRLSGLKSVIKFLELLDLLAGSRESRCLASEGFELNSIQSNSKRLHSTYQYIIQHFNDPELKMSHVAAHVNLSDSAFSHFFKKSTNKSFTRFLIDLRMGYACRLLQESDDLVKDIARSAGFNNMANFNRLFRKTYGSTPRQYRKFYQEKNRFDWSEQTTPGQFLPADVRIPFDFHPQHYATRLIHA